VSRGITHAATESETTKAMVDDDVNAVPTDAGSNWALAAAAAAFQSTSTDAMW